MCLLMPAATCTLYGVRPPAFYPLSQFADPSMPLQIPQQLSLRYVGWADHPWWHGPDGAFMSALNAQLSLLSGTWPDMCNILLYV